MAPKRVLIIVGDFVEDYEAFVPYQAIKLVGHHVDTISPGKKAGDKVKTAIHDFEGYQTYTEKVGHNFEITADFDTIDINSYDGLFIPGGRAPEYLRLNERVIEIVKHFAGHSKLIGTVCHGPQILVAADVVRGHKMTAYFTLQHDVVSAGGIWVKEAGLSDAVVSHVGYPLISGIAWPSQIAVIRKFLEALGTKIEP
eukprot:TRINITY_DN1622_c0_g1_i2.p1 TRINITY_DN1622_c0_g1~~TRINITY_DN1622_c0_g1_i2.p1  ORF type:complete len:198 (+),score=37.29 TRINITY_DN1622_c0_g1_i2:139-732(+)